MVDKTNEYYNSIYSKLLESREQHAKLQKKNYSHVFRKKTFFDILRLSALAVGIGFVFAAETAFVSPTLLEIGVKHSTMTMVWALSPVLGLFLAPILGSLSDRCRLSLGRRRPLILLLSCGIGIGFCFLPFGRNIGQWLGDDNIFVSLPILEANSTDFSTIMPLLSENQPNLKITIILTVIGVMVMDFSTETLQGPARAYMLEVCIAEDHNRALSTFSIMAGLGSAAGYAIGGVDWESTALGHLIGGNMQAAFTIDAIFFAICFLITFLSFREIPLPLMEKDKMLQPLVMDQEIKDQLMQKDTNKQITLLAGDSGHQAKNIQPLDDCYEENTTVSLGQYLKTIVVMPKSLWILCLTNLFCWMGHVSYCMYFTDFVGEEVFHGEPTAPITSQEYKLYEDGVRFGGVGMTIYALSCSFYSFIIEKLMNFFKPKYVYIFGIILFSMGMFILAAFPSKVGVIVLSVTAGVLYGTINTMPFIIVANYHAKGCFEKRNGENISLNKARGLGTDIAIVSSMLFIAQLIVSLGIGFLVTWMGTTCAIFYAASGFSVCAAVTALFILYI